MGMQQSPLKIPFYGNKRLKHGGQKKVSKDRDNNAHIQKQMSVQVCC